MALLQPSVITLNHLIVCCSSAKEAQRGLELFQEIDVEANLVTYNALIACCKKAKLRSQAAKHTVCSAILTYKEDINS